MALTAPRDWPGWRRIGVAFILGVGVGLGQVPFGLWPVALACLSIILWQLAHANGPRAAFWTALFAGAGHFGLALSWIIQPFFVDPWRHGWMAPFALTLMAFGMALFWAAAAALAHRFRWPFVATACLIAAVEMLRSHLLTGFPWALIGHMWLDTQVEQVAALAGAHGLTLGTLLVAAGLAAALQWRQAATSIAVVLAAVAAVGWGTHRLSLEAGPPPGGVVRLVQPNVEQTLKWDPDEARATFDRLLDLTVQPPAAAPPALAIWPETAVPFLLREGEGAALAMGSLGLPLAAGFQRVEGERAWNSLGLFGPDGQITQTYDKLHLVPFGEYIPMGDLAYSLLGLRAFAAQLGAGYSAGTETRLMDLGPGLGLARPLICYEAIFSEEIATATRPNWLLQVTNDAWFGTLTGPYQHFALARLRAIEQGLPLVRVANTGISAVVDAKGQIAPDGTGGPAYLPLGVAGVIDAPLPGSLPPPPYARFGDLPVLALLLAGLLAALLWPARRDRT